MSDQSLLPCDQQTLDLLARSVANDPAIEALARLDAAITSYPLDARLHLLRGALFASMDAHDSARADLSRATLLSPSLDEARFMLGQLAYMQGSVSEARALWGAFQLPNNEASSVALLGAAMIDLLDGNRDDAHQRLTTALDRQPSAAVREHVQRLLGQMDTREGASGEAKSEEGVMAHFLLSDYLSGQMRH